MVKDEGDDRRIRKFAAVSFCCKSRTFADSDSITASASVSEPAPKPASFLPSDLDNFHKQAG